MPKGRRFRPDAYDAVGRVVETREFNRSGFLTWLASLPRDTVVAMEACGGAHC